MKSLVLGTLFIIVVVFVIFILKSGTNQNNSPTAPVVTQNPTSAIVSNQSLIIKAENLFQEKKNEGVDFENGPCLSEDIAPDWVVDIAHNPRTKIDDDPQNQCQNFRSGKAHHFIELDTNGALIRGF